jgi:catechol 2,3-dioxygenase-like lactoylglutathione lyase family enzyme
MYLDYCGLRVTNLPKAKRFLTNGLGLREVRRGRMPQGGIWVLFEDPASHQFLELNWYPRSSKYATPFVPGEGLDHLGFRVSDIPTAAKQLVKAGAKKVDEVRYRGRVQLAFYEGPDGLWIELIRSPTA